jgi:hypothetical protein
LLSWLPSYTGYSLERELINELLPTSTNLQAEVFEFFCLQVMLSEAASSEFPKIVHVVMDVLADAPDLHLSVLVKALFGYVGCDTRHSDTLHQLDLVVARILKAIVSQTHGAEGIVLRQELLHVAVWMNWTAVCRELGLQGASVHDHVRQISALELACSPKALCFKDTFGALLETANPIRLNDFNPHLDNHVIGMLAVGKGRLSKLERLLQVGANPNIHHPHSQQPVIIHHFIKGSSITAKLLLQYGASYQSVDDNGFDVAFGFVWNDMLDELVAFHKKYPQTD